MAAYRRKPSTIEAEQFWPDKKPWPEGVEYYPAPRAYASGFYFLDVPAGKFTVSAGDWICRANGCVWVVEKAVFNNLYVPVRAE